jgi:hypothetical protein
MQRVYLGLADLVEGITVQSRGWDMTLDPHHVSVSVAVGSLTLRVRTLTG